MKKVQVENQKPKGCGKYLLRWCNGYHFIRRNNVKKRFSASFFDGKNAMKNRNILYKYIKNKSYKLINL